jgi:hypothetical protein
MLKFISSLFILISSFVSGLSEAVEITDLYRAIVAVDSQAIMQRKLATKKALQEVLLKVGGKRSVLSNSVIRQAINSAERYQTQYHYQRKDNQLNLVVNFNDKKVNQLFQQANLPLWGSLRPQVLLWLVEQTESHKTLISDDVSFPINNIVNKFSVVRGLPIMMPSSVSVSNNSYQISDFWEYFPENIQQASQRYSADTHVVMRVSDSSLLSGQALKSEEINKKNFDCGILCITPEITKTIDLDWRIYSQGTLYVRQYQGEDKESLIRQGLSDITEFIYQSYALLTSTENDLVIEIRNIKSLLTDNNVFNFISSLSSVNNIILLKATSDIRRYKLDLVGSEESFFAALKLNKNLKKYVATEVTGNAVIDGLTEQANVQTQQVTDNSEQTGDFLENERGENKTSPTDMSNNAQTPAILTDNELLNDNSQRQFNSNNQPIAELINDESSDSQNISGQKTIAGKIAMPASQLKSTMKIVILGEGNIANTTKANQTLTGVLEDKSSENSYVDEELSGVLAEVQTPSETPFINKPKIPVFYWEQQ